MRKAPAPLQARTIAADALTAGAKYVRLVIHDNDIHVSFTYRGSDAYAEWTRDTRGVWNLGKCLVTHGTRTTGRTLNAIRNLL